MRWIWKCCCVICVLLMLSVSAAADVDAAMIESMEDASVFLDDNGIDTVIPAEWTAVFWRNGPGECSAVHVP